MPLTLLQDWCRGEHLNTQRSMLILGIPEDCGEDEFEETLQEALRHLGRVRRQKTYWKKGKTQSTQTAGDLSGAEGQGSQAQVEHPQPLPTGRDPSYQAKCSSVRSKNRVSKRRLRQKQGSTVPSTCGVQASEGNLNKAEAEEGKGGGSGIDIAIWPPPNAHPVGSELRTPTGSQATWDPEEPSLGPPLTEGTSVSKEELRRTEGHWRPGESRQGDLGLA
ncbi:paraneoplastic antigen-like protein 8B isoform X2 [Equus quagga]|uniref:paraneoplastic antigen-like protein 8B isoform X2 n=1 Tax=Equus quagga TaxID=89248 RepID=UPI001EE23B7A|nr:paraneoplastic antigen-like protein 8B isoform X2 [Equus quagga]